VRTGRAVPVETASQVRPLGVVPVILFVRLLVDGGSKTAAMAQAGRNAATHARTIIRTVSRNQVIAIARVSVLGVVDPIQFL
jgi:hypothetical protein